MEEKNEKTNNKEEKKIEKVEETVEKTNEKKEEKKEVKEEKDKKTAKVKVKKTRASVNVVSIPISKKHSMAISRFIKGKTIERAIEDLQAVIVKKKAVPMKGEIPHRKGRIMSGRYPKKASEYFIMILKSLQANSNANGIDEPVIVEVIPNMASRPYGRFGRIRKKRTHISITAVERKTLKKNKSKNRNQKK